MFIAVCVYFLSFQVILVQYVATAAETDGAAEKNGQQTDQSLLIGIFIGIWICISCYVITGWIVDMARKRHIFCKLKCQHDKDLELYTKLASDRLPTVQSIKLNDLQNGTPVNHQNDYCEVNPVKMKGKPDGAMNHDTSSLNNTTTNHVSIYNDKEDNIYIDIRL